MIRHIPGPAGRLEALMDNPTALCTTGTDPGGELPTVPRAGVVLAHPHPLHGGTMHSKVVFQAAKAFCRLGCVVLRFNFRGVGTSTGAFDEGRGEQDDYRAALRHLGALYPEIELWAAGFSFGAWVAMTAGLTEERVSTLIGIALPVGLYEVRPIAASPKPKYLIHGERDELTPLTEMWRFYATAVEPKELVVIDAANHVFDGHASEVGDAIADLLE